MPTADIIGTRSVTQSAQLNPALTFMKRRPLATKHPILNAQPAHSSSDQAPAGDAADKKWQVDQASGVPAPVIRTNMISLRLSYQGRIKVAFFEQD